MHPPCHSTACVLRRAVHAEEGGKVHGWVGCSADADRAEWDCFFSRVIVSALAKGRRTSSHQLKKKTIGASILEHVRDLRGVRAGGRRREVALRRPGHVQAPAPPRAGLERDPLLQEVAKKVTKKFKKYLASNIFFYSVPFWRMRGWRWWA